MARSKRSIPSRYLLHCSISIERRNLSAKAFFLAFFHRGFFAGTCQERVARMIRRTMPTFILIKAEPLQAARIRADVFIDVSSKSINSIPHYANSAARSTRPDVLNSRTWARHTGPATCNARSSSCFGFVQTNSRLHRPGGSSRKPA